MHRSITPPQKPSSTTVGFMTEMRFLRSVPNRLRSVIVTAFAIYGGLLLATALGYRVVGGWLANHGTPFPGQIIFVTGAIVFGVILTDLVSRRSAGEAPKSANDRFNISNDELRVMAKVIPIGFCFIAVMAYGFISSGGWGVIPHSPGAPYRIFHSHDGFVSAVSEERYRHIIEGNLLFAIGMSLVFITMCYGVIRTQKLP
jgi:hypothetical protein